MKKQYKSIKNFHLELEKTKNLIEGIVITIKGYQQLRELPSFESLRNFSEEHKEKMHFDENRIKEVYEMGLIRIYASFESFMYEFLKELYAKFPSSLPTDRKIEIEQIIKWKTKKSIHEFIIDHIAIENSYDLNVWEKTLEKNFGITVFESSVERDKINLINICRNMILHSGGKLNSKIVRDSAKNLFIQTSSKKGGGKFNVSRLDIFDEGIFLVTRNELKKVLSNIEKNLNKKKAR